MRKALPGLCLVFACAAPAQAEPPSEVFPGIASAVVHHYDFEHPLAGDAKKEDDIGRAGSRTPISFNKVRALSIMTWVKITGEAPARNSNSSGTGDFYGAIGFAGVLTGNSDGHAARALLETENHGGSMKLIALARRVDGGDKQFWVSKAEWKTLVPPGKWVFLAGTFDFDNNAIGLYVDGKPVEGAYAVKGDPWKVVGPPEPDFSSATNPRGIKIGGSHPQNNRETNACNCRMDGLMFLDRALTAEEVRAQYDWVTKPRR